MAANPLPDGGSGGTGRRDGRLGRTGGRPLSALKGPGSFQDQRPQSSRSVSLAQGLQGRGAKEGGGASEEGGRARDASERSRRESVTSEFGVTLGGNSGSWRGSRPGTGGSHRSAASAAERAALGLQFESKADAITRGLRAGDWRMRVAVAKEFPALCERRPVGQQTISLYTPLLKDKVMEVRRAALQGLSELCEVGDRECIRAVLDRMWADESWAVRLLAIKTIEAIAMPNDAQALMGCLGRVTDPEARRGGRFLIREAAIQACLLLSAQDNSLKLIVGRLRGEGWAEIAQAIQALLLASHRIPCRLDDENHPEAPKNQGFVFHPEPVHFDPKMLGMDEEGGRTTGHKFIGNRHEVKTKQSEILPRRFEQLWKPPQLGGSERKDERTHEWEIDYRFSIENSGLEQSYYTENTGRHFIETEWSRKMQIKSRVGVAQPPRRLKHQEEDEQEQVAYELMMETTLFEGSKRDPRLGQSLLHFLAQEEEETLERQDSRDSLMLGLFDEDNLALEEGDEAEDSIADEEHWAPHWEHAGHGREREAAHRRTHSSKNLMDEPAELPGALPAGQEGLKAIRRTLTPTPDFHASAGDSFKESEWDPSMGQLDAVAEQPFGAEDDATALVGDFSDLVEMPITEERLDEHTQGAGMDTDTGTIRRTPSIMPGFESAESPVDPFGRGALPVSSGESSGVNMFRAMLPKINSLRADRSQPIRIDSRSGLSKRISMIVRSDDSQSPPGGGRALASRALGGGGAGLRRGVSQAGAGGPSTWGGSEDSPRLGGNRASSQSPPEDRERSPGERRANSPGEGRGRSQGSGGRDISQGEGRIRRGSDSPERRSGSPARKGGDAAGGRSVSRESSPAPPGERAGRSALSQRLTRAGVSMRDSSPVRTSRSSSPVRSSSRPTSPVQATDQPPHTRSTGPEAAMPKPSSAYPDALPSAHSVQATGSGETTSSGGSFRAPPRAAGQGLRRHATMMSSPGGASEGRHLSESFSSGSRPGFGQSVDGSSSQDDLRSSRLGSHGSAAAAGRGLRRHLTMSPSPGRSPGHPSAKDAAGWQRAKAAMQDHSSLPVGSRMNFGESFGTTALLDARRYNVSTIKTSAPDVSNASPFD